MDKFLNPLDVAELSSDPSNPGSGFKRLFAKTDDQIYALSSGGGKVLLSTTEFNIPFIIDGGGSVIQTGLHGGLYLTFPFLITEIVMGSTDPLTTSGSIVVDLWVDSYANFPPTVADSITASAKPTISSATKSLQNTFSGWITSIPAGRWLYYNVDSVSSLKRVLINIKAIRI
jgi:hypothetical protein